MNLLLHDMAVEIGLAAMRGSVGDAEAPLDDCDRSMLGIRPVNADEEPGTEDASHS